MTKYSIEQQTIIADQLLAMEMIDTKINLKCLFNSIKTDKNIELIKKLLVHPIYDIQHRARKLAKVLKLQTEIKPKIQSSLDFQVVFAKSLEKGQLEQVYALFKDLPESDCVVGRYQRNKTYLVSECILNLFKEDAKVFRTQIEKFIIDQTADITNAVRLIHYYKMLNKHTSELKIEAFQDVYDTIKLENEWVSDPKVSSMKIVDTFKLLKDDKISAENLKFDHTLYGKLLKINELEKFSVSSQIYINDQVSRFLHRSDLFDHYTPDQMNFNQCTNNQKNYYTGKLFGDDVEAKISFINEQISVQKAVDLDYCFVLRNRQYAGKSQKQIYTTPMDALLYPSGQEVLEMIPLIKCKAGHLVEAALFNKKMRFFNSDLRIEAMKTYIVSGFIYKDIDVVVRSIEYYTTTFKQTSAQAERTSLQAAIQLNNLLFMFFVLCNEMQIDVKLQFQKIVGFIVTLSKESTDITKMLQQMPTDMTLLVLQNKSGFKLKDGLLLDIYQCFINLQQELVGFQFVSTSIQVSILPQARDMLKLCLNQFDYKINGVLQQVNIRTLLEVQSIHEVQTALLNKIDTFLSYQHKFFTEIANTIDVVASRKLQLLFNKNKTDIEKRELELINLQCNRLQINTLIQFDDINIKQLPWIKTNLSRAIISSQQIFQQYVNIVLNQTVNMQQFTQFPITSLNAMQTVQSMDRMVEKIIQLITIHEENKVSIGKANFMFLHQYAQNFLCKVVDLCIKSIIDIQQLIEIFSLLSTTLQKLVAVKYDEHELYAKYYESIFSKKKVKTSFSLDQLRNSIQNLTNLTTASKSLQILYAMMKFYQYAPLAVFLAQKLQNKIKIDKKADLTILFQQKMPMSALKSLIKLLFTTQTLSLEYISKLFVKSSTDAKSVILLQFYELALINDNEKQFFLQLIEQNSVKSADAILLFFSQVFNNDEKTFNISILNAMSKMQEQPTVELLNFAGFLGIKLNISNQDLIELFESFAQENKEQLFVIDYMLQLQDSVPLIIKALTMIKHQTETFHTRLVYKSIENSLSQQNSQVFNASLYNSNKAQLAIDLMAWFLDNEILYVPFSYNLEYNTFSGSQLSKFAHYNSVMQSVGLTTSASAQQESYSALQLDNADTFTKLYFKAFYLIPIEGSELEKVNIIEKIQLKKFIINNK